MSRAWVLPGVEEGSESFAEARTKATPAALQTSRTTQQGDDVSGLVSKDQRAVAYTVRHPDDIAQPPSPLRSARMGIRDGAANNMTMPTLPCTHPQRWNNPAATGRHFCADAAGMQKTLRWEPRGWKLDRKAPRQQNRTMAAWYPSLINDPWLGSRLLQQPRPKGLEIWWTPLPWKGGEVMGAVRAGLWESCQRPTGRGQWRRCSVAAAAPPLLGLAVRIGRGERSSLGTVHIGETLQICNATFGTRGSDCCDPRASGCHFGVICMYAAPRQAGKGVQ